MAHTEPNMAGSYLQPRAWRVDCVLHAQSCRSHVFHVIDDVRDMRSWTANNKPWHNRAGEEMKWCRVWECWNYARAEICIEERELSKSVIGCSFSVGYQVCWIWLGVGADALVLDQFTAQDANSGIKRLGLMMSFCYFKWLPFYYSSVCCHVFFPWFRSFWHMKSGGCNCTEIVIRGVRKIAEWLFLSSCLSFCPSTWSISAVTGQIFIKSDIWEFFENLSRDF